MHCEHRFTDQQAPAPVIHDSKVKSAAIDTNPHPKPDLDPDSNPDIDLGLNPNPNLDMKTNTNVIPHHTI